MVRQLGAVPPISIHALREEGDRGTAQCTQAGRSISIHALREEGDYIKIIIHNGRSISIHALREEGDPCFPASRLSRPNFYPRPPRGGRLAFSTSKYLTR